MNARDRRPFGVELKARRKKRFPKASDFAQRLGVSPMEVSRWEREEVRGNAVEFPQSGEQLRLISELLSWPLPEIQDSVTETRRRLGNDETELRDHGILYAAGWSELSDRDKRAALAAILAYAGEQSRSAADEDAAPQSVASELNPC